MLSRRSLLAGAIGAAVFLLSPGDTLGKKGSSRGGGSRGSRNSSKGNGSGKGGGLGKNGKGQKGSPAGAVGSEAQRAVEEGRALPLRQIESLVSTQYPGTIIEVQLAERGGRLLCSLKILSPANRINTIIVDALSGAVVR